MDLKNKYKRKYKVKEFWKENIREKDKGKRQALERWGGSDTGFPKLIPVA